MELPSETPEIHALLAKLQDVATAAGGNLEPDWSEAGPGYRQRKATAPETSANAAPNWEHQRRVVGKDAEAAVVPKARCVLEDFTPCSKSHLWKLMMSFYDRKGVESWSQVGIR